MSNNLKNNVKNEINNDNAKVNAKKFLFVINSLYKILIILAVLLIDLLTKKTFYLANLSVLPQVVGFRPSTLNTGGAWSIFNDKMYMLIIISIVFLIFASIFDFFFKSESKIYNVAYALIIGGTIGNLIDRLFLGGVRDFIFFEFMPNFPTFNLADSFLCVGMILLLIFVIFIYKPKDNNK